jgi:hypothetical protein
MDKLLVVSKSFRQLEWQLHVTAATVRAKWTLRLEESALWLFVATTFSPSHILGSKFSINSFQKDSGDGLRCT